MTGRTYEKLPCHMTRQELLNEIAFWRARLAHKRKIDVEYEMMRDWADHLQLYLKESADVNREV